MRPRLELRSLSGNLNWKQFPLMLPDGGVAAGISQPQQPLTPICHVF